MARLVPVAVAVLFAISAGYAMCAQTTNNRQYSQSEIRQMIHDAHSAEQYQAIASYFRSRQQSFEQQAQSEKVEWGRRSQITSGPAEKYPRPVDSSKNRYEYFTYEAQQMGQQADHFNSLAAQQQ
jgi:hypothetical protein